METDCVGTERNLDTIAVIFEHLIVIGLYFISWTYILFDNISFFCMYLAFQFAAAPPLEHKLDEQPSRSTTPGVRLVVSEVNPSWTDLGDFFQPCVLSRVACG